MQGAWPTASGTAEAGKTRFLSQGSMGMKQDSAALRCSNLGTLRAGYSYYPPHSWPLASHESDAEAAAAAAASTLIHALVRISYADSGTARRKH